jgi:serine/threonine protein kinase
MGVVYRATQLSLERPVALKAIAPELADDVMFRERFKRESRIAASIEHPNVIPVYEAGRARASSTSRCATSRERTCAP